MAASDVTEDRNYTGLCSTGLYGTYQKILYSTVNSTLAVIAIFGNALIVAALQKVSSLRPPSKLLLGCLATTDLCVGLITQPIHTSFLASPEDSKVYYYLNLLFNSLAVIFGGVSLFTLTAISVDRLLALLSGLRYRQVVTLRRAWMLVAAVWLFSLGVALMFFLNFRITLSIISIAMFFCVVTSIVCNTKIYLTLRHHQAQVQDNIYQGRTNGGETSLNVERYKKTVSSALWVQIALGVCYLPYAVVATIFYSNEMHSQLLELLLEAAVSFVLFNSSLNPFLYCWKMKEVRQAVKFTINQLRCFST